MSLFKIIQYLLTRVVPVSLGGTGSRNIHEFFNTFFKVVELETDNYSIAAGNSANYLQSLQSWVDQGYFPIATKGWYLSNASSGGQYCSYVNIYGAGIASLNGELGFYWKFRNTTSKSTAKIKMVSKIVMLKP